MKKIQGFSTKALAFLVAISIMLSSIAISFAVLADEGGGDANTTPQIWSGETADSYGTGSGNSSDDPILIENAEQLAKLCNDSATEGKYYMLTNDIYLNDTSVENWTDTAKTWVVGSTTFKGVLDGNNHTISGIYYNGTGNYVGLFSRASGTVAFKNLTIKDSYLHTTGDGASAFFAFIYSGTNASFERCYITDTVDVKCGEGAAGFVGYGSGANIVFSSSASFAKTAVTNRRRGSFIGNLYWSSSASRSVSYNNCIGGDVYSDYYAGEAGAFTNSYCAVSGTANGTALPVVSLDDMKGEAAKTNMPNLNWQRVWKTTENGYPKLMPPMEESTPGGIWSGKVAANYASDDDGTTPEKSIKISNGEQLAKLNFDTDTEGKYYELTHDIILNDSSLSNWKQYAINWVCDTASAQFKGTLLGNGHTIYGLYYKGSANTPALLKTGSGNVNISRIVVDGVHLETTGYCPATFVGVVSGESTNIKITECYVKNGTISSTDNSGNAGAGGFVGWGNGKVQVEDSAYIGTVTAPKFAGAFIGNCWTNNAYSVKNSFTNANILFSTKKYINDTSKDNYGVFNDPAQNGVTLVTDANMKGTQARENMPKLDWGRTWKVDNEGGYPLPVFPAPDGTVGEVWTGNTANNFAGGDGSEENPYLIATGEQLLKMVKSTDSEGKFYKLIADIKLNDTTASNWKDYARQWECSTATFKGTFDGDGHTITGLYYKGEQSIFGLFSRASNALIKRFVISNSSVTSSGYGSALLVGYAAGSINFVEVYIDETNEINSTDSSSNRGAGGFVGYGGGAVTIEDSAYLGTVEGTDYYGAFLGHLWTTPLIKNSFTSANLKLSGRWALSTDSQNNYGAGSEAENGVTLITADKMLGADAKVNMPNLDWGRTWVVNESGYPLPLFPDPNGTAGEVWTGNTAVKFNGGSGTEEDPYQIATGEQLLKMVLDAGSEGTYYKQTYDIKLNDTTDANWKESARNWLWNSNIFKGNFDGNGFTIDGLYYNGNKSKVGLFCYAKDATFKNIIIKNSNIYSTGFATGTLVGDANSGKISVSKCYVENGYVESTYDTDGNKGAGGIVGYGGAEITVTGSAYLGTVKAPEFAGAILGNCWATVTIKNSFSNAGIRFCSKQELNKKSDNNYSTYSDKESYVISIAEDDMKSDSAKVNMGGLDWKKIWKTTDGFPVLNFDSIVPAPTDVWTGAIAETFESGTGTESDPYIIVNGEQLALMLETESAGVFFKLDADIKLNDTTVEDWIYGANQWIWTDKAFEGTFDGNGHIIEGLYYNGAKSSVGFIPRAKNANIKNVEFKNPYLKTANYAVATVVGNAVAGEIKLEQCYVSGGYVESTFDGDGNRGAGGLVGYGSAAVLVEDSAYLGKVIATGNAGAIIGNCWWPAGEDGQPSEEYYLIVKNTFSNAGIKFCTKQNIHAKSDFNYSTCKDEEKFVFVIDEAKMKGASATDNMSSLNWRNVWKTTDSFPVCRFGDVVPVGSNVWSGEIADGYASGIGTESDPYIIKNGEQLAFMVLDTNSKGKYFKLANDIILNDTSADDWQKLSNQWIWTNNIFEGTFDGNGHTIEGLYYNGSISKIGLISYAKDAVIKSVRFLNSYIKSAGYATGTVVGDANSGTVTLEQCYVENGYVESTYTADSNKGAGGLIGYGGAVIDITGSAFIGTVKAEANAGAILGNCWAADEKGNSALTVTNTFSNAGIKFCTKKALSGTSDNNYSTCKDAEDAVIYVKESKMKGLDANESMSGLNWKTLWKPTNSFPVCNFDTVTAVDEWNGNIATKYAGGEGTKEKPYLITNGDELAKMVLDTESAGKYYKLTKDIKLNDTSAEKWTNKAIQWVWSNNIFQGNFDGDGHTIEGLYYNGLKSKVGLFGYAKNATIQNVRFLNSYIKSAGYATGTVVGDANSGTVTLEQCYVENGYVESTYTADSNKGAGGLIGYGGAEIKVIGSAFIGTVKAEANAGAILGNCWAKDEKGESALTVSNTFSNAGIKFCTKKGLSNTSDSNYSTCKEEESAVISIEESKMKGSAAIDNMPSLNWKNLWKTSYGFPVCNFDAQKVTTEWNGDVATNYAGGEGTKEKPYLITNGDELAKMVLDRESAGKYYKLTNDIKLNDTSAEKWTNKAIQWVWSNNIFQGNFDGDGHTIEGLYYNGLKSKVGLFGYAKNATIENVRFLNSYIKSAGYATGTVVGDANSGTVTLEQCYVENGYVESTYTADSNKGAGGLIGYGGAEIKVTGCAYIGTVKAEANAGAILGNCWAKDEKFNSALVITNTFSNAGIKFCSKQSLSGLSDNNYINCDSTETGVVSIETEKMLGKDAVKYMTKLDWGRLWKTSDKYPVCRFGDVVKVADDVWSGNVALQYAGGDGTENNPYLISNGEELAKMVLDTDSEGKYYKQIKDIKLNDTSTSDWTVYAKQWIWTNNIFKGYFDGDTKTITGLYYNGTKSKVGLFCYAANATIKRVVIDYSYINSSGYATGTLVGDANQGTLDIIECYVTENSSVESTFGADNNKGAGGLIGYGGAEIKISGSAYLGSVKAPQYAGALLGNVWTSAIVTNSFATPEFKFSPKRGLAGDSASNYGTYVPADEEDKEAGVFSVKVSEMKGEAAKKNMPALNWARSWKTTKDGFPVLNVGEYEGKKGAVWSGRLAKNYAGGSGTKDDPYLIATPEQLAKLAANILESKGKYYKLVADIYLNDISKPNWQENANEWFWVSSARKGNFNGHFNGDGHVIYGLAYNLEQANSVVYAGLFPTISDGTVIEKTGISNSHLKIVSKNPEWETYVGAFVGAVFYNKSDEETDPNNLPVISQCFADSKVVVEGKYAGGIVGGGGRTSNIYNSYFIGTLIGERVGAIIGNTWTEYVGTAVTNCYSATTDADIFSGGRAGVQNSSTPIAFKDNYANSSGIGSFVTQLGLLMMRGEAAKKNMPALDFDKIWYAVENGTPVLRIFGTTDKFSNTSEPKPIKVSFVTNGGTECEPLYGNPEDKLTLPTTTREGYKFEGWYVYKELDMKYPVDYFPYFDQILYAKWTPLGIIQDFEDYTNTPYDYTDDYEYYRPGTNGYNADFVRSGMSAMHRIGADGSEGDFLINYEDTLEIGTQYKISFWVNTDTDGTKADISIVHEDFPDVFDSDSGVEKITTLKGMKQGEWQEVVATFTAKSKWLAIRTSGNASIYFEDFMIIPTTDSSNVSGNAVAANYIIFIIIGAAVVLLAGAAVVTILIIKKRKLK